jgi:hypothetical protein
VKAVDDHWHRPQSTHDYDWRDWLECPAALKSEKAVAQRAVIPITRALRRDPAVWTQIPSPWREMDSLRREAAECWAASPGPGREDPPEDIRELVQELLAS